MKGMSNKNGGYLNDLEHLKQSIIDILTTPIGPRVICRNYGSNLFQLIDIPINREPFSRIYAAVAEAIDKHVTCLSSLHVFYYSNRSFASPCI